MKSERRATIVNRLREKLDQGLPVIGGGAGTGISAKCEEAAGIDLIVIYNSGRYRMAGRGSLSGLMPYGNANQVVREMAYEVLTAVQHTPVLAGVCATDPFMIRERFLAELKELGFAGIQNFPTVGLIDGNFRANLEETGMGFGLEVDCIAAAHPASAGLEAYRGDQIAHWVFQRGVFEFAAMTNLSEDLRSRLPSLFALEPPPVEQRFVSADHSRRYLLRVDDDEVVEAVHMPKDGRATLCISSQVGCRFACTFCQTGLLKLQRSLGTGEIVGQVLRLLNDVDENPTRTNVVFMGQGEPLDNPEAVIGTVKALQDPTGPGWSWRRITVSTVGLVPGLERLAELGAQRPRIAISLNATTDDVRSELMPINRKYPIATLVETLRGIEWRQREKVTFEYVLLAGVNDTADDARRLGRLLRGLPAKVNLIPWNRVEAMPYARPALDQIEAFRATARRAGLDVLVRYSRGADIGAACGQLQAAHRVPN